jgi:hypothetical protein
VTFSSAANRRRGKFGGTNDKPDGELVTGSWPSTLNATPGRGSKFLDFMTPDLGKLLFPRLQPDQRRREMHALFAALLTGLIIAGAVALVMLMVAKRKLY